MAVNNELLVMAARVFEEEELEFMALVEATTRLFALVMVAMEEEVDIDEIMNAEASWQYVTVNMEDYYVFSDVVFKMHFRMNCATYEALIQAVGNHLVATNRMQVERTPLRDILMIVIWILATPDTFRSVALRFGKRPSVVYYFYSYIIESLREMAPQYIRWPDEIERGEISGVFERATGFPGVCGCIDCTHVYITAPVDDAVNYRNRHHSYSINVQAVVDHNLTVRDLHVGEPGSMNDQRVFRRSALYTDLLEDVNHRHLTAEQHVVGDGAYTLTDFMMSPYENNGHLTERQLTFNKRLSQSRVRVENAFARAKGKWRRLKMIHSVNQENLIDHITASFVLHNFILLHGEQMIQMEDLQRPINEEEAGGIIPNPDDANNEVDHPRLEGAKGRGLEKRIFLTDYVLQPYGVHAD